MIAINKAGSKFQSECHSAVHWIPKNQTFDHTLHRQAYRPSNHMNFGTSFSRIWVLFIAVGLVSAISKNMAQWYCFWGAKNTPIIINFFVIWVHLGHNFLRRKEGVIEPKALRTWPREMGIGEVEKRGQFMLTCKALILYESVNVYVSHLMWWNLWCSHLHHS
jgi:hypothetical protein